MASWKCWYKSLHALSQGLFTALIKVALQHTILDSLFQASAWSWEGYNEGRGAGEQQKTGNKWRDGKLHQSATCMERDQNEDSGKGYKKGVHTQLHQLFMADSLLFSRMSHRGLELAFSLYCGMSVSRGACFNSVPGAGVRQLQQCCNNYQSSLLSHPPMPVHCAALLLGSAANLENP